MILTGRVRDSVVDLARPPFSCSTELSECRRVGGRRGIDPPTHTYPIFSSKHTRAQDLGIAVRLRLDTRQTDSPDLIARQRFPVWYCERPFVLVAILFFCQTMRPANSRCQTAPSDGPDNPPPGRLPLRPRVYTIITKYLLIFSRTPFVTPGTPCGEPSRVLAGQGRVRQRQPGEPHHGTVRQGSRGVHECGWRWSTEGRRTIDEHGRCLSCPHHPCGVRTYTYIRTYIHVFNRQSHSHAATRSPISLDGIRGA
ncbi:hypothetical protein LY78DRAFT_416691 [Colletotrichum sublineola]|nr:hypothetical protein LY78DRAFT_416691 [Colletotrichum sublineola]